jgi:hypothetical protein
MCKKPEPAPRQENFTRSRSDLNAINKYSKSNVEAPISQISNKLCSRSGNVLFIPNSCVENTLEEHPEAATVVLEEAHPGLQVG